MAATKIIFKRSSLLGKRPTDANLEPGEIGLNTNSTDPGLFFETNNGSVVKAGPTSYLPEAPTFSPARGELWVDSDTKTLSIGNDSGSWETVAAPFLGGTGGFTVFVAPDYPGATDSLANDGQTVPFVTINRAVIEVTKNIILDTLKGLSFGTNRYLIVLAPGKHCVVNRPGVQLSSFTVDFDNQYQEVTQEKLAQFNPEVVGGLILPRGVSIIGMDLKKSEVHPTYVPKYTHPAFPIDYTQQVEGPIYKNQPLSSVFKWTGNTYVSNFTCLDKVDYRLGVKVVKQEGTEWALVETNQPHGLDLNDFVQITYSNSADRIGADFEDGAYYVNPVNSFRFLVSPGVWGTINEKPVLASEMPQSYFTSDSEKDPKFRVWNIYPYYIPEDGVSYELSSYSHHRLSVIKNASLQELNAFYSKVQLAFPGIFGGRVSTEIVTPPEYEIVAPAFTEYPQNVSSNSTDNSSPYQNSVNHRSDYGMANGDYDGNIVSGFKSVIVNASTAVVLQKDPVAYEVYSTSSQDWVQLTQYAQQILGNPPIESVPTGDQLSLLNQAAIPNIRYYYTNITIIDPDTTTPKSIGIPDPDNDFRHFGFRVSGPNSYIQAQSTYTIGAAIACWIKGGGLMSLTNATTNFGSVAFQAEGFAGIGTLGGANEINKGFLQTGIVRPLQLSQDESNSDSNKRILSLGSKVIYVGVDPSDPAVQLIYLQRPFEPETILPYSLKPGTALFVGTEECDYVAYFVTDGTETCILQGPSPVTGAPAGAILRVRMSDSTIPDNSVIDPLTSTYIPYIRRFVDPRTPQERSYGFSIQSTNPTSQAPQLGSVLRLNQTGQSLSNTLKRNFQFDPGPYGGISQVFTVDLVETENLATSTNFNYKIFDAAQDTNYVAYVTLSDASYPWIQSVPVDFTDLEGAYVPFNSPQGSYLTFENKNYYAAENNLWSSLYYQTSFDPLNGPTKVSPNKNDSPYVITSVLEKTELVSESWQGLVPDPLYEYYTEGVPSPYRDNLSYFRGAVVPYTEFAPQYQIDEDDGSPSMGIIFRRYALDADATTLIAPSTVIQTPEVMTSPYVASPTVGRPEILNLPLLSVKGLVLPKSGVSVLQLTNNTLNGVVEYVRVIGIISNQVQVIRNYYPQYAQGTLPAVWPKGTTVKHCAYTGYPEPSVYDPDWAPTKATVVRFFELMGYKYSLMAQYLKPEVSGNRILTNTSLPLSPTKGYANLTASWPIEFNNPSAIIANTHTWQYAGYFDYSRGLPKYQVNEIPRKLSYDYLSMTTWGGRLTVTGANETGQLVFFGPIREAVTGQFFENPEPLSYAAQKQLYTTPPETVYPNPIIMYSVDDVSGEFDGTQHSFELKRGGYPAPSSQLSDYGVFVFVGGVVQQPGVAYSIQKTSSATPIPLITFTEAPLAGTSCDIRIITSDDEEESAQVVSFRVQPAFDGAVNNFELTPFTPSLTNENSFIFLGGVEQNPFGAFQANAAYSISHTDSQTFLTFLGGTPEAGTVSDFRGVLAGSRYRTFGLTAVSVVSVDDISLQFDGIKTNFPLTLSGQTLDPGKVNSENMVVSLGGVIQIPISQEGDPLAGDTYDVSYNTLTSSLEITFTTPPMFSTTCNIRVITSEEFLTCPSPDGFLNPILEDGPGIIVNEKNQIVSIDSGLIQP